MNGDALLADLGAHKLETRKNRNPMRTTMKPVLVTTKHRGVFAGLIPDDQDLTVTQLPLQSARMAIYWGTTRGIMELCDSGPTEKSRISAPADIPMVHDITAVFAISDQAWEKWQTR